MPTYGVTSTGFVIKPLSAILADIESAQISGISPSLDVQPTAIIGIDNGIIAQALSDLWEMGLAVYNALNPAQATGDSLTNLGLISGTDRLPATKTQVLDVTVNVNAGFTASAGTMFASVSGNPVDLFVNKADVANGGGTPANETVNFEAVNTGPIQCVAGTLTVIATPLSGWNTVTNANDGIPGSNAENDADFRIRRTLELEGAGSASADAIRADVLAQMVPPTTTSVTTSCTVLFNDTDYTDANDLLPHSIEVIANQPGFSGNDNDLLAQLIFDDKAAGIQTNGNVDASAFDAQGNEYEIKLTRPTSVDIYVEITVSTDSVLFPSNGSALIKAALADYALASYQPGDDVYALHLQSQAFTVPGVLDITVYKQGKTPSPSTGANIAITIREVASLSTGNITVTVA